MLDLFSVLLEKVHMLHVVDSTRHSSVTGKREGLVCSLSFSYNLQFTLRLDELLMDELLMTHVNLASDMYPRLLLRESSTLKQYHSHNISNPLKIFHRICL